ncbi:MAG: hypothetical protein C4321_10275 [Chloroflexota bacterium]
MELTEIARETWERFFDDVTARQAGAEVEIEVADVELGDQEEAIRLPLASLTYDPKDEAFIVSVGGRDGRLPVVLRHIVEGVLAIAVDIEDPVLVRTIAVEAKDRATTVLRITPKPVLPPAEG